MTALSKRRSDKKFRVLIVEDHPLALHILDDMLQEMGCQTTLSDSGYEAIQTLAHTKRPYDLIFMDIGLPDSDGLAVTREIRTFHDETIPIVGITGKLLPEELGRCQRFGMNECLIKPLDKATIGKIIARYCKTFTDGPTRT